MSSNRLNDDKSAITCAEHTNNTAFSYVMNTMQYEHKKDGSCQKYSTKNMSGNVMCEKKRNLVDVESTLRGQKYYLSKCSR